MIQLIFVIILVWRGTSFNQLFSRINLAVVWIFLIADGFFAAGEIFIVLDDLDTKKLIR